MIVETKINTFNTPERIRKFDARIGSRTMYQLGGVAKAIIVNRTLLGRDQQNTPFKAYSTKPMYAPIRNRPPGYPMPKGGKLSRTRKTMFFAGGYRQYKTGLGRGARVQLSLSGEMMGDIQVRAEKERAILYFGTSRSAAIAHGHHFGTVVPKREFFGIGKNPREVDDMEEELANLIVEYASDANVPLKGSR